MVRIADDYEELARRADQWLKAEQKLRSDDTTWPECRTVHRSKSRKIA
jgi:hypothetical protein